MGILGTERETICGVEYQKPKVTLLKHSGIGVSELAGRTCYDSFQNSENECIRDASDSDRLDLDAINDIEESDLLSSLAWVHHHHSIIEHATLSYLIQGTSRGVLQEHARHRLQSISVRSTRYTMSTVLNAFVASVYHDGTDVTQPFTAKEKFIELLAPYDMFVTTDERYNKIELGVMWDKLDFQRVELGDEGFILESVAKSSIPMLKDSNVNMTHKTLFESLQAGKNKRNVGDGFKHTVSDNWKVDMVVTFNIRSLKNYFDLRDSGSAWFQIQWLAQEIKRVTPLRYLKLIDKKYK